MARYRWFIVGISFFAIIINYLDRTALSYAITLIESTFGLTNTDFGMIAAAFSLLIVLSFTSAFVIIFFQHPN